ncbi:serine hydrolase domain-containing protein [Microlunatus soli]|uniref:CubicO group peptidase, beta-lactamase class C family n=1 Tax=Microlunatus soli TaxID=630515 RepID=A0A1H1Z825_9ACTN|nr:serine hydrolase domain-containing protein [Microlunatus soli]SDT29346.1 CubicO group peptidase, beta-lactamase class C family [Microlunatus soli]
MNLLRLPTLLDPRHLALRTGSNDAAVAPRQQHRRQPIALPEAEPAEVGMDAAALQRATSLASRRGAAVQLCVIRHGRVVSNQAINCEPDGLFWIFSASKPYTTVLIHQLAERGLFDLDDPVATYWPEFGQHGKDGITIRHVLQHRTGFATAGGALRDVLACTDWQRAVRIIEGFRPRRQPGTEPAYQFLIFGFILGEVVQRITGRPFADVLFDQLIEPLQVADTHLGIGPDLAPRQVPVEFRHLGGRIAAGGINRPATRQAVMPSAGISATGYDVARFYQMLLDGGLVGDRQLISPEAIRRARTPSSNGEIDGFCRAPVPWSLGFQLGGLRGPGRVPPFGYRSSRNTFGHNGSNCCVAWADTDRDLAFAYLTNLRSYTATDMAHLAAVADHVFAACRD